MATTRKRKSEKSGDEWSSPFIAVAHIAVIPASGAIAQSIIERTLRIDELFADKAMEAAGEWYESLFGDEGPKVGNIDDDTLIYDVIALELIDEFGTVVGGIDRNGQEYKTYRQTPAWSETGDDHWSSWGGYDFEDIERKAIYSPSQDTFSRFSWYGGETWSVIPGHIASKIRGEIFLYCSERGYEHLIGGKDASNDRQD